MNNTQLTHNIYNPEKWYINNVVCESACPLNIKCEKIIENISNNKLQDAIINMLIYNPFPSITGRLCRYPCEEACNRKNLDNSVNIQEIEKFVGDLSFETDITFNHTEKNGKKVLIIGAGLTGLSSAFFLNMIGFKVDIFEKSDKAWGMLNLIPDFELEKKVLDNELNKIKRLGVNIYYSKNIEKEELVKNLSIKYDAVLMATGKNYHNEYQKLERTNNKVFNGLSILNIPPKTFNSIDLGEKVIVLGINDIGLLCARYAIRHEKVKYVEMYNKESKGSVTSTDKYLKKAREEGIRMNYYSMLDKISNNMNNNLLLHFYKTKLDVRTGELTAIKDSGFDIKAGSLIDAYYNQESSFQKDIVYENSGNIFIYDEITFYKDNVLDIIENSRNLSERIYEYLMNKPSTLSKNKSKTIIKEPVIKEKEKLNILPVRTIEKSLTERVKSFEKVVYTYTEEQAEKECERCFRCSHKIEINLINKCISCGICVDICPTECFNQERWIHPYLSKAQEIYPAYIKNIFDIDHDNIKEFKMDHYSHINTEKCIRCRRCVNNCPVNIIEVKRIIVE